MAVRATDDTTGSGDVITAYSQDNVGQLIASPSPMEY